jgi:hypothetical protein
MKKLAFVLIILSLILSSVFSIQDTTLVEWNYFIPSIFIGIIGIFILKRKAKLYKNDFEKQKTSIDDLKNSLNNIINNFSKIEFNEYTINNLNNILDDLFLNDINIFINSRNVIKHRFGILEYSKIMSHFAAAERLLNRAWSASIDSYIDEVRKSLASSNSEFKLALDELELLLKA